MAKRTAAFRRNNQIIENSEFDFGTDEQRSETQTFVNEKVHCVKCSTCILPLVNRNLGFSYENGRECNRLGR